MSIGTNLSNVIGAGIMTLTLACSFPAAAQNQTPIAELKVLAIGNSFSGNANLYRESTSSSRVSMNRTLPTRKVNPIYTINAKPA